MSPDLSGFVAVEGGQLYYEVTGTGHPLLLIHAGVADLRMWDTQVAALADQYRVIRYDTRGFGRTTSENVSFSNRQDIVDLLNHLGVTTTYVMGLSRGGMIALDFTLEYPDLVAGLIVVAGGMSGFEWEPTPAEIAQFDLMETAEKRKDFAKLTAMEVRMWVDGPSQPEGRAATVVRENVCAMIAKNYQNHTEELEPRGLEPPAFGRLAEVGVPVLVIIGGLDVSDTIAAMHALAAGVPNGREVVFPDTAHMVNMEQPERFNAVVRDFLANI